MTITDVLAPIGAITGVLALYLNWKVYRRDRSRLDLSASLTMRTNKEIRQKLRLEVVAVNAGRRPVRLTKVGFEVPPGQFLGHFRAALPHMPFAYLGPSRKFLWIRRKRKYIVVKPYEPLSSSIEGEPFRCYIFRNPNEPVTLEEEDQHVFALDPAPVDSIRALGTEGVAFAEDTLRVYYRATFGIGDMADRAAATRKKQRATQPTDAGDSQ